MEAGLLAVHLAMQVKPALICRVSVGLCHIVRPRNSMNHFLSNAGFPLATDHWWIPLTRCLFVMG